MTVTISRPTVSNKTIAEMTLGEWGADDQGRIYLRTMVGACCLNVPESSYSANADEVTGHRVEVLPPGTEIVVKI